jgi:hypothetical protein
VTNFTESEVAALRPENGLGRCDEPGACHRRYQFEEGNAAGGHAGGVEAIPYPAVASSMTSRRSPPPLLVVALRM